MKRLAAWVLAASLAAAALADEPAVAPLTAAQIVDKNAAARGGVEAWRRVETMAWAGHVESPNRPGRRMSFVLEQKRPDRTRFEVTVDGQKALRVFDGSEGWKMRMGGAGAPEVQPYSADELKFARAAPVIEGPLMDYAGRGATVSLDGAAQVEGRKAYGLALRLASGSLFRVWVDAETFLELRYDREFVDAQGKPMLTSVYFASYREVEGLQLPFVIETGSSDGKTRDKLVIERVVLNPPLDLRAFGRPDVATARRKGVSVDTRSAAAPPPAPRAP